MKQIFLLLIILYTNFVRAEIRIEITQGINTAQPIAIIPFKWTGTNVLSNHLDQIITADLKNSGKFNPIDYNNLPQKPFSISEITPYKWNKIGINTIVIGQIQPASDNQYTITYQMVDVVNSPNIIMIKNQFKVPSQWFRYAAHNISNEIFQKLTGIPGAFCTRIAYIVKTNKKYFPYELRVSDYDGYNQFIIHRSPEPLMSPTWSFDGEKIAYVTFEKGNSNLVMQTLINGEINTISSFNHHNGAPAFSPDGKKIAFALSKTGNLNIYIKDLITNKIHQITNNRNTNTEPSWMPDNKTIIYTSDQAGYPQIYKINIYEGIPERITWEGTKNQDPNVSIDGKFMVMVSSTSNGQQNIAKQDFLTGNVEYLTDEFINQSPHLSPNGTMIIYSSSQKDNTILQLISTDGRFKAILPTNDGQVKFPAWSMYL